MTPDTLHLSFIMGLSPTLVILMIGSALAG